MITPRQTTLPEDGGPQTGSPGAGPPPPDAPHAPHAPERTEGLPAQRTTVLPAAVEAALLDRWSGIQDGFAADPRGCVQDADHLIEDITAALLKGIGEHRARLAAAWQDGRPDVVALDEILRDYRTFISILI